jgi:uncharacterized protein
MTATVTPFDDRSQRLIDPKLFSGDGRQLMGSTCSSCTTTTFPAQRSCPRCGAQAMKLRALPDEGVLWAYTVQSFPPKPPYRFDGDFVPFGLGYVDLGPVIVEARLTESDPRRLRTGQPLRLTRVPAFTDDDGVTVLTYAFEPMEEPG